MVKTKYITQYVELTHPLDNLNLIVRNETTELVVNLNYGENEKVLDLSNFDNLKKLFIVDKFNQMKKPLYDWLAKKYIKHNLILNSLSVISSSIIKINCMSSNISRIMNLPNTLTHLRCSNNDVIEINYLPPTLKVLELSECNLANNKVKLNNFYLPELEILKINSNKIQTKIEEFIPQSNNLKIFECANNKLLELDLISVYAENLQIFKCSSNQLVNLDNLPYGLEIFNCSHNLVKQLDNLPTGIKILDCSYNEIEKLDYLPSSIIKLNCSYNKFVNLDNLPSSIKHLIIISNKITQVEK